jgi:hypothetical protein
MSPTTLQYDEPQDCPFTFTVEPSLKRQWRAWQKVFGHASLGKTVKRLALYPSLKRLEEEQPPEKVEAFRAVLRNLELQDSLMPLEESEGE